MDTSIPLSSTNLPIAATRVLTSLETARVSSTAQVIQSATISPMLAASTMPLPSVTTSAVKESDRSLPIQQTSGRELETSSLSAIPSPEIQTTSSPSICSVTVTQSPICESDKFYFVNRDTDNTTNIYNSDHHMSMIYCSCS